MFKYFEDLMGDFGLLSKIPKSTSAKVDRYSFINFCKKKRVLPKNKWFFDAFFLLLVACRSWNTSPEKKYSRKKKTFANVIIAGTFFCLCLTRIWFVQRQSLLFILLFLVISLSLLLLLCRSVYYTHKRKHSETGYSWCQWGTAFFQSADSMGFEPRAGTLRTGLLSACLSAIVTFGICHLARLWRSLSRLQSSPWTAWNDPTLQRHALEIWNINRLFFFLFRFVQSLGKYSSFSDSFTTKIEIF